ncbi:Bifunctional aspartokinase/homoserine dehydrogenase 2 [Abeliophyllum distichum]|uniref:Bifunctional aspartokinase/homoserine dehydrogenase 2 n=1 Tax=Abeliophyllum distichum TaxID=126358 RepID=A0ABD1SHJ4_9LAMI
MLVIILARESGLKLELSDIPVQSLVPESLKASGSAEEFLLQLPQFDEDMAERRQEAEAAGEVLRYVGVVDVVNQKGIVELRRYKKEHPFAQLSGSDNIIAFTTQRYEKQPLIVRGPGAGAEVTAGGETGAKGKATGQSRFGGGSFFTSNTGSVPPATNSRLSPLPPEPADFYNPTASVDIPLDSAADLKKKERELQAKEAELRRRE